MKLRSITSNNQGAFLSDIGLVLAVMLVFSLVIIIGYKVFTSYNDKWQTNPDVDTDSKVMVDDLHTRYVSLFDGIFMFVFALLAVMLLVSSVTIGSRPEFFFVTVILSVFVIGGAAVFSNIYETVATNEQINSTSSQFSFVPFIMGKLPTVALLFVAVVMIGLYVKIKGT